MRRGTLALIAMSVVSLGTTTSAAAQTPTTPAASTFEIAGGYQAMFVTDDPGTTFPLGVAVDLAINAGAFGFVAEGGWSRRTESHAADEVAFDFWHAGIGVRWTRRVNPRLSPYAQVLLGAAFHDVSGSIGGLDQSDRTASFMFQPGGGVARWDGDKVTFTVGAELFEATLDADSLTLTSTSFRGERMLQRAQDAAGTP